MIFPERFNCPPEIEALVYRVLRERAPEGGLINMTDLSTELGYRQGKHPSKKDGAVLRAYLRIASDVLETMYYFKKLKRSGTGDKNNPAKGGFMYSLATPSETHTGAGG